MEIGDAKKGSRAKQGKRVATEEGKKADRASTTY